MKNFTKTLLIILMLFISVNSVVFAQDGEDPEDITNHLGDMQNSWSFGNACGVPFFMDCNVYSDMEMNGHLLQLLYCKVTVHGVIKNNGVQVSLEDLIASGQIVLSCDEAAVEVLGETLAIGSVEENLIEMWPNPASDIVTVKGLNIDAISVLDINGRIQYNNNNPTVETLIQLNYLASGIYFVYIEDLQKNKTIKKLIVK